MRSKIVAKNSAFLLLAYFVTALLSIVSRPLFVRYLTSEYLGFDSIVMNIMTLLSMTEGGIGICITYRLYAAFADKDENEIGLLIGIYRIAYRIVGAIELIFGLLLIPVIISLTENSGISTVTICVSYLMYLISTVSNYYIGYYRLVYVSDQKEYICAIIDSVTAVLVVVGQIIVITIFRNYYLYVFLTVLKTIIPSIVINMRKRKEYSYIKKVPVSKEDIRERNVFRDIKNASIQQIAYTMYGGIDSIIISYLYGLSYVTSYTNYMVINSFVSSIFSKLLKPLQASIGNFVYATKDLERQRTLFESMDLLCFILSSFIFTSYITIFQPVITIWMGVEYLLPLPFVLLLAFNFYISATGCAGYYFRMTLGEYELDRKYIVLSAVINIVFSIILGKIIGIIGIILGTVCSSALITYGRNKVTFKKVLFISQRKYYGVQIGRFLLTIAECAVVYCITYVMPTDIFSILIRAMISFILTFGFNCIVFWKSESMQFLINRFISIIKK